MPGSPRGTSSGSFATFQQESFEGEARADVLLQVAQRVVGKLEEMSPPALFGAAAGQHAAAQLDLPAGDREQSGVFDLTLAATPRHLAAIELRRDPKGYVGGRAEDFLETPRPLFVKVDHPLVAGHAQSPARPAASELRQQAGASRLDIEIEEQSLDVGRRNRMEENALAPRHDGGQHDEGVEAGARPDDYAAGVWR